MSPFTPHEPREEPGQVKRLAPNNNSSDAGAFMDLFKPILEATGLVAFEWDMVNDNATFTGQPERIFGSPVPVGGGSLFFDRIHPDDRLRIHANVWATAALPEARGPQGAWGPGVTWRVMGFDGTLRTVRSASIIFADALGKPLKLRGFFQDQTEQQAALEALHEAERYRERIAVASPHLLYVIDLNTRKTLYQNRSFWSHLGYNTEEALSLGAGSHTVYERLHPDDRGRLTEVRGRWRQALDGEVLYTEIRLQHKDGTWRTLRHADMVFERGADGLPTQLVGVAEDVTERRALEQQLLQAQKMESVGELAGGVAHDFNNLLTIIQGYVREARGLAGGEGALESVLARLELAASRGASLTGQLLAFARRQPLDRRDVEMNAWLTESSHLIQRAVGEAVELSVRTADRPLWVRADPIQLEQVLLNLALNSRDAMRQAGQLRLEVVAYNLNRTQAEAWGMAGGAAVALRVLDNGDGMTDEVRVRALEPFFTTKAIGKGTGLGLSTCFGIVKQHHGHLLLESEPGLGSTVSVFLPRLPQGVAEAPGVLAAVGQPQAQAATVLLTEDLDDLRDLMERLLKHEGYEVLTARDGEEALRLAEASAKPIDALLTDLGLPKLSGKDLILRLRERWPQLKVLATSGHPPSGEGPATWLGPHGRFIAKPFNFDALLSELRALLGG